AAATAGFFCLKLVQPQFRPHRYRRVTLCECFAPLANFLVKVVLLPIERFCNSRTRAIPSGESAISHELLLNLDPLWRANYDTVRHTSLAHLYFGASRKAFHYTH